MKRLFPLFAFFVVAVLSQRAEASPRNLSYSINRISVEGVGDSLLVSVKWTFNDWEVEDSKAIVFDMSLKHGDNEVRLRPVVVYGRNYARSASAYRASGRNDEIQVFDLSRKLSLTSESVLPYKSWMDTVKVLLAVKEWNGRNGLVIRSTGQKGCFAKPCKPSLTEFEWDAVEPPKEYGTDRRFAFTVPVMFEDGSQRFDAECGDNRRSLSSLLPRLRSVTSSDRYQVRNARLVMYSAPSGDGKDVRKLSLARLQSVYSYVQKAGAFMNCKPRLEYGGEDWDGVLEWLSGSRYGSDERLIEIVMSSSLSSSERLRLIQGEKPAAWDDLVADCFPFLGRVSFEADFKPRPFQAPRYARSVFDDIPELLTPYDFWYVSTMYLKSSPEWMDVILTGVELNPESEALCCNAVFGLVAAGAPRRASALLRNVGESPAGLYAKALWLYSMGRYVECADILESLKAVDMFYLSVYENAVPFIDWTLNYVSWEKVDL